MTHLDVKNDLLACLEEADFQTDILLCLESVIEQVENPFNDTQSVILKRREIIRLKNAVKKYAKRENGDLEKIFLKLWWSRKRELNIIAAHLLADLYSHNNKKDIESIKTLLWRLDNRRLCNEVVCALSSLVQENMELWKDVFIEWANSDFKWNRLIGILLIQAMAEALTLQIPELLRIVALYMEESNEEIQNEVGKCISLMTLQWDLPVLYFLDKYQLLDNPNTQIILQKSKL